MVLQRGLGPPFWFPGGSRPPFWVSKDPMWPHSAPGIDLWTIVVLILGVIWNPKSIKFAFDFSYVFGMLF